MYINIEYTIRENFLLQNTATQHFYPFAIMKDFQFPRRMGEWKVTIGPSEYYFY